MTSPASDISFLRSALGMRLIEAATELALASKNDPAEIALKLKRLFPDRSTHELHTAIDLVVARAKGAARLGPWAKDALLTTRSVEQASRPEFSRHRAARFRGAKHILEIGTAAGFDTAMLARVADRVTTLEPDRNLAEMAQHNLAVQGIANVEIIPETAEEFITHAALDRFDGLFADPSRRSASGARIRGSDEYLPPLSLVLDLPVTGPRAIKISPAIDVDLPAGWTREFLGLGGECLEQTLWFGVEKPLTSVYLADTDESWGDTGESPYFVDIDSPLTGYFYDPHPALVRSRAVGSFYAEKGIHQLDPRCAYGVSSNLVRSPFLQPFRIIDTIPFRIAALSKRIHTLGWSSRTEIKKRGVDVDPDEVRRKLKLPRPKNGAAPFGVVLIGRRGESLSAILAERI